MALIFIQHINSTLQLSNMRHYLCRLFKTRRLIMEAVIWWVRRAVACRKLSRRLKIDFIIMQVHQVLHSIMLQCNCRNSKSKLNKKNSKSSLWGFMVQAPSLKNTNHLDWPPNLWTQLFFSIKLLMYRHLSLRHHQLLVVNKSDSHLSKLLNTQYSRHCNRKTSRCINHNTNSNSSWFSYC